MFWTSGAHIDGVVSVSEEMQRRILAGQSHTHTHKCVRTTHPAGAWCTSGCSDSGLSSVWIATETNRGGELIGEFEEAMTVSNMLTQYHKHFNDLTSPIVILGEWIGGTTSHCTQQWDRDCSCVCNGEW